MKKNQSFCMQRKYSYKQSCRCRWEVQHGWFDAWVSWQNRFPCAMPWRSSSPRPGRLTALSCADLPSANHGMWHHYVLVWMFCRWFWALYGRIPGLAFWCSCGRKSEPNICGLGMTHLLSTMWIGVFDICNSCGLWMDEGLGKCI